MARCMTLSSHESPLSLLTKRDWTGLSEPGAWCGLAPVLGCSRELNWVSASSRRASNWAMANRSLPQNESINFHESNPLCDEENAGARLVSWFVPRVRFHRSHTRADENQHFPSL